MSNYKDLKCYHVSKANAFALYRHTRGIKGSDNLSIRTQLIKAAFSVPSNIVEGSRSGSDKEFARFLGISIKSSHELDFHLETLSELDLLSRDIADQATKNNGEARKMLCGLRDYLSGEDHDDDEDEKRKKGSK